MKGMKDIRVLSYNIHKGKTFRKSTLNQIRAEMRVLHPDIIFLQEACNNQFEFLAAEIWPHFSYGKNAVYTKGHHGNAILSKFPIQFSHNLDLSISRFERRGLLHSIIQIPFSLHLLCVHLGLHKKLRRLQLAKIIDYIHSVIPKGEPFILAGDFNDWREEATTPLIKELGLKEVFLEQKGKYATTFPSWLPLLKLDRIYTRGFHSHSAEMLNHISWKLLSDHLALTVHLTKE